MFVRSGIFLSNCADWYVIDLWRCSNYIRLINNFIAHWDASYIRGLRVYIILKHDFVMRSVFCLDMKRKDL